MGIKRQDLHGDRFRVVRTKHGILFRMGLYCSALQSLARVSRTRVDNLSISILPLTPVFPQSYLVLVRGPQSLSLITGEYEYPDENSVDCSSIHHVAVPSPRLIGGATTSSLNTWIEFTTSTGRTSLGLCVCNYNSATSFDRMLSTNLSPR